MERIRNNTPENDIGSDNEEEQQLLKKTFGRKVVEVFNQEGATKNVNVTYEKYIKNVQGERALLGVLNVEERSYQDYIFYKAIEDNPEASQFIKNIPGLDTSKPLIAQLLEKNEDGSQKVSDETVGNILEFYQSVLKKEEGKLVGDVERIQLSYETNLKKRVEMGQLPQALYENYKKAKQKNGGSITSAVKLFDFRPWEDEGLYFPAGATAFVQHSTVDERNEKGEIINSENTKILYKKAFLEQRQEDIMGSLEIMLGHEMTHVIAGMEASFNLLPSKTGSANIPSHEMDTEGLTTMAFREGMTEAIGQMIMDSSPEASSHGLDYYLGNGVGGEQDERKFIASLIGSQLDDDEQELLKKTMLEAYAETDEHEFLDALRRNLRDIFSDLERFIKESLDKNKYLELENNPIFWSSDIGTMLAFEMEDEISERESHN